MLKPSIGEKRRADIKARFGRTRKAPLWTFERPWGGAASWLSAAAQDSAMAALLDLRTAASLALNELIELKNFD
jgi:hypothetical protein